MTKGIITPDLWPDPDRDNGGLDGYNTHDINVSGIDTLRVYLPASLILSLAARITGDMKYMRCKQPLSGLEIHV